MIIILDKDGNISVKESPLQGEGNNLKNLAAFLGNPSDGDTIVYNATKGIWEAGTAGSSFAPTITSPQDGDTLVYNAAQQKWVNGASSENGSFEIIVGTTTAKQLWDAMAAGKMCYVIDEDAGGYISEDIAVHIEVAYSMGGETLYFVFFAGMNKAGDPALEASGENGVLNWYGS